MAFGFTDELSATIHSEISSTVGIQYGEELALPLCKWLCICTLFRCSWAEPDAFLLRLMAPFVAYKCIDLDLLHPFEPCKAQPCLQGAVLGLRSKYKWRILMELSNITGSSLKDATFLALLIIARQCKWLVKKFIASIAIVQLVKFIFLMNSDEWSKSEIWRRRWNEPQGSRIH